MTIEVRKTNFRELADPNLRKEAAQGTIEILLDKIQEQNDEIRRLITEISEQMEKSGKTIISQQVLTMVVVELREIINSQKRIQDLKQQIMVAGKIKENINN